MSGIKLIVVYILLPKTLRNIYYVVLHQIVTLRKCFNCFTGGNCCKMFLLFTRYIKLTENATAIASFTATSTADLSFCKNKKKSPETKLCIEIKIGFGLVLYDRLDHNPCRWRRPRSENVRTDIMPAPDLGEDKPGDLLRAEISKGAIFIGLKKKKLHKASSTHLVHQRLLCIWNASSVGCTWSLCESCEWWAGGEREPLSDSPFFSL